MPERLLQPLKAEAPMLSILFKAKDDREEQPENALSSMVVTSAGRTIDSSCERSLHPPILVISVLLTSNFFRFCIRWKYAMSAAFKCPEIVRSTTSDQLSTV